MDSKALAMRSDLTRRTSSIASTSSGARAHSSRSATRCWRGLRDCLRCRTTNYRFVAPDPRVFRLILSDPLKRFG